MRISFAALAATIPKDRAQDQPSRVTQIGTDADFDETWGK